MLAHDLVRPAYARRSIGPHEWAMPRLRAGGKPVPIPDQVRDRLFRDHASVPDESEDILDGIQGFGSERARAIGALGQDGVDIGRILHQTLHLGGDG